jgi:cytochrome c biogenesis protein CcdA
MRKHTQRILFLVIGIIVVAFFSFNSFSSAEKQRTLVYYGDINCHLCHEAKAIIESFGTQHPDVNITYHMLDMTDIANRTFLEAAMGQLNITYPQVPALVLNDTESVEVIFYQEISLSNLNYWYDHGHLPDDTNPMQDMTTWVAFVSGLVVGASPCVLLILSVFGTSLTMETESKHYLRVASGFISGLLLAYILVSFIFVWLMPVIGIFNSLKYIFGGILLIIGLWQILDMKNENSKIFGTPTKIKEILKNLLSQNSGIASMLLGFIFAMIKIPCFGGIYLSILYSARDSPQLFSYVISYLVGMILPVIGVFLALKFGLMAKSINSFRQEYRPYLRLLSGMLLITLTGYLLLTDQEDYLILLWIILLEVAIVFIVLYFKRKIQIISSKTMADEKNG